MSVVLPTRGSFWFLVLSLLFAHLPHTHYHQAVTAFPRFFKLLCVFVCVQEQLPRARHRERLLRSPPPPFRTHRCKMRTCSTRSRRCVATEKKARLVSLDATPPITPHHHHARLSHAHTHAHTHDHSRPRRRPCPTSAQSTGRWNRRLSCSELSKKHITYIDGAGVCENDAVWLLTGALFPLVCIATTDGMLTSCSTAVSSAETHTPRKCPHSSRQGS